jgi:hypothetical protein
MEPAKSAEEVGARLERLVQASKTDKKLRQALLSDPAPVLLEHGIPLAPGLRIRFVEADPAEVLVPLPKYEGPV